jgi:hypothetical protein
MLVDVIGSAYVLESSSHASRAIAPVRLAMWIPAQLLAFALGLVLWRGRSVRRWLQRRDAETLALNDRIAATRERILHLREGKDVMISALDRLAVAADARVFDDLTLSAAETVRALLASDRDVGKSLNEATGSDRFAAVSAEV